MVLLQYFLAVFRSLCTGTFLPIGCIFPSQPHLHLAPPSGCSIFSRYRLCFGCCFAEHSLRPLIFPLPASPSLGAIIPPSACTIVSLYSLRLAAVLQSILCFTLLLRPSGPLRCLQTTVVYCVSLSLQSIWTSAMFTDNSSILCGYPTTPNPD